MPERLNLTFRNYPKSYLKLNLVVGVVNEDP